MLSESSIRLIRRELRKSTAVLVTPEEVVGAIRRLLNEAAVSEMEAIRISFPERKHKKRPTPARPAPEEPEEEAEVAAPDAVGDDAAAVPERPCEGHSSGDDGS